MGERVAQMTVAAHSAPIAAPLDVRHGRRAGGRQRGVGGRVHELARGRDLDLDAGPFKQVYGDVWIRRH